MIESEEGRKIRQFLKEQGAGDDIIKSIEESMQQRKGQSSLATLSYFKA